MKTKENNIQEGHQLQAFLVNLVFLLDPGGDKKALMSQKKTTDLWAKQTLKLLLGTKFI